MSEKEIAMLAEDISEYFLGNRGVVLDVKDVENAIVNSFDEEVLTVGDKE